MKWGAGITVTNNLINDTVLGNCTFIEANPSRVLDQGHDLVDIASRKTFWECNACGVRHLLGPVKTSIYVLLGIGLIDDEDCAVVWGGDFAVSSICGTGLWVEPYHTIITTSAEHKGHFGCRRKANSKA